MKRLLFVAMATMAMTACSNDEVSQVNPDNAIGFRASSNVVMRTATIDSAKELPAFQVWAYNVVDGNATSLMTNVTVSQNASGDWAYSPVRYWPNAGTCDFYGIYPAPEQMAEDVKSPLTIDMVNKTVTYNTWPYDDSVGGVPVDFMYAVNTAATKDEGKVAMNFRHAMSQIVFQVKNTNSALKITIPESEIQLMHVNTQGVYALPSEDTTSGGDVKGGWSSLDKKERVCAKVNETILDGVSECLLADFMAEDGAMVFIPQEVEAWDYKNDANNGDQKAYFRIKVLVEQEETVLWPGFNANGLESVVADEPYWVAVPVEANFEQGKRYIYTLIFGNGAGIVPPDIIDPDPVPEPGTPVLGPIEFTVTVDAFDDVVAGDVTM